MSDDDDTPPHGRALHLRRKRDWGDTERIEVGADHRRAEFASTASERQRRGIPEQDFIDPETTSPVSLFERELSMPQIAMVSQGKRNCDDGATYGDVLKLADRVFKREATERDKHNAVAELDERVAQLERDFTPIKRLGRWALAGAGGAVLTVGVFLYLRGFTEGGNAAKFESLSKIVDELRSEVRQLEQHHSAITPAISPDAVSSATLKDIP